MVFRGNEKADEAAELARQHYPASLFQIWEQLASFLDEHSVMRDHLRNHILRVAEIAVSHKEGIRKHDNLVWDTQLAQSSPEVAIADMSFYNWVELNSDIEDIEVHALLQFWLQDLLTAHCDDREPTWLSSYQLLIDFQNVTGCVGFRRDSRKTDWYDATLWVQQNEYDFLALSRHFQACLKSFATHYGFPFHVQLRRPGGELFQCWTKCICLAVSRSRFLSLDVLLRARGIGLIKRVQKSFAGIKEWPLDP